MRSLLLNYKKNIIKSLFILELCSFIFLYKLPLDLIFNLNRTGIGSQASLYENIIVFKYIFWVYIFFFIISFYLSSFYHDYRIINISMGVFFVLLFLIPYPNFVHHIVYGRGNDVLKLLQNGTGDVSFGWPIQYYLGAVLYLFLGLPKILFPSTINLLFIIIFFLIVPNILGKYVKQHDFGESVYIIGLFWFFIAKNSILYEFGYHDQWIGIFFFCLFIFINSVSNSYVIELMLFISIVMTHLFTSLIMIIYYTFYYFVDKLSKEKMINYKLNKLLTFYLVFIVWVIYNYNSYSLVFSERGLAWIKGFIFGIDRLEYIQSIAKISGMTIYQKVANAGYKYLFIVSNFIFLVYICVLLYRLFIKKNVCAKDKNLVCMYGSIIFSAIIFIASQDITFSQRWIWHIIFILPIGSIKGMKIILKKNLLRKNLFLVIAIIFGVISSIEFFSTPYVEYYYCPNNVNYNYALFLRHSDDIKIAFGFDSSVFNFYTQSYSTNISIINLSGKLKSPREMIFDTDFLTVNPSTNDALRSRDSELNELIIIYPYKIKIYDNLYHKLFQLR